MSNKVIVCEASKTAFVNEDDRCEDCRDYYPAADVERLVEAAREFVVVLDNDDGPLLVINYYLDKLKAALEPFKEETKNG